MQFDNSNQFFVPGTHPIPAPKTHKPRKHRARKVHRKKGHVVHRGVVARPRAMAGSRNGHIVWPMG